MRPYVLFYLYRNRLRVNTAQELLAGLGVAIAVALVFATLVANSSVARSAEEVVRAAVGPANLQLRARGAGGFDQRLLGDVEHLAGVRQAAPLLEQIATIRTPAGRTLTLNVIGTNVSLAILNGLAHSLPGAALSPTGIGLSSSSAKALGLGARIAADQDASVTLKLRGSASTLKVSAVLGAEAFGALSRARLAVMPLERLQSLAGLPGRVSRILVQTQPGREAAVRGQLEALSGGRLAVASADQDISLLDQALAPSDQASALFAVISALLGFLFAFNALLLTIPERRQAIADLRVDGTGRSAIIQMVTFQGLCLGIAALIVGLLAGFLLSRGAFHQSPGYLSQAFTLGTNTVIGVSPVLLAFASGVLATCLASGLPLLDLRRSNALDAVYAEDGMPGSGLNSSTQRWLAGVALGLVVLASALFALVPSAALIVCVLLAVATVLTVPSALAGVLGLASAIARRYEKLMLLTAALTSLRATTMRSLALAATGAVALFGSVALGGSRDDLLRGISDYTSHYVGAADIWLVNPGDNQAINDFTTDHHSASIAQLPGVASVRTFQGSFLNIGDRRIWLIAWPSSTPLGLLEGQLVTGSQPSASERVDHGGWITISAQLAAEHHVKVGDVLNVPSPAGEVPFRVAATTTNFGWTPGAIVMNSREFARSWNTTAPTALGVTITPDANSSTVASEIQYTLGRSTGLEVLSAPAREAKIDASASEGLSQLGDIATLLVIAAILAMIAALGSSIWQARISLAGLRLEGATPRRLRIVLLIESTLMLSAGCLTGAIAGIYGQVVIDGYLKHVTGFPVANIATGQRPLEIFALVLATVLVIAAIPGWMASRVPATFALDE